MEEQGELKGVELATDGDPTSGVAGLLSLGSRGKPEAGLANGAFNTLGAQGGGKGGLGGELGRTGPASLGRYNGGEGGQSKASGELWYINNAAEDNGPVWQACSATGVGVTRASRLMNSWSRTSG